MGTTPHPWWDWGYGGIFICVFLEQAGVPIPALPALLAAGALIGSGELNLAGCLLAAVGASLLADLIWFQVGRAQGGKVLNLICRLSWRPDTCVSKTKNAFVSYGSSTLLFSKFIPGLSVLAPPLAGMARVPLGRFVLFDGLGAAAWALIPLVAGSYLKRLFEMMAVAFTQWRGDLPLVCGVVIIAVLIGRYAQRRTFLRRLARGLQYSIDADALKVRLDRGEDLTLLDIRDELAARAKPSLLPGARWLPYTVLPQRIAEVALDKPIVVYCDCPHDEAAVSMADWLRGQGARDVRPLHGGLEDWLRRGWPITPWENGTGSPVAAIPAR